MYCRSERMPNVTFRAPKNVIDAVKGTIDPNTGEKVSDFMRIAVLERLEKLEIKVKNDD